jgi:preprotein translocase subunit SecG
MYVFLLIVHALIAASLVAVILMQRSEGGSLASGGNSGGLMSARGAADFLTRTTAVLATIFVVMSILLAALATVQHGTGKLDTSLAKPVPVGASPASAPTKTPAGDTNPKGTSAPVPLAR